ncbi:hypothetical protein HUW51_19110 [Adhaeribacter swui]|uniref:Lipoprotein n=1 Tax=Adhaeribacter swui TaxID=2086471 RepID=A0A7G7GC51_9BACT|nr:hypothetical protein [Adhaeribacter swui]QNF34735.1 hypothetical protein HUW51_19110 [Adhaeribacter swui]
MKSISIQKVTASGIIAGLFGLCLLLFACSQDSKIAPQYPAKVPPALAKKWISDQFPINDFWNYTGTYPGKMAPGSLALAINPDGDCELYQITGQRNAGGLTEAFTYQKGKVKFHADHSFTFYPSQGNIREYIKICDAALKNSEHQATHSELTPRTFYYSFQANQQDQLLIRANHPAIAATTLHTSQW